MEEYCVDESEGNIKRGVKRFVVHYIIESYQKGLT